MSATVPLRRVVGVQRRGTTASLRLSRNHGSENTRAFLTGAGARTEHYEIAAYEGLVTMANAMGEDDVARLLNENLAQEQNALRKIQTIGKRLAAQGAATTAA